MHTDRLLLALALVLPVGACGGVALGPSADAATGDSGRSPVKGMDSGPAPGKTVDGGPSGVDGGTMADGRGPTKGLDATSPGHTPDGSPTPDESGPVMPDGGPTQVDGGPVQRDGGTDGSAPPGSDAGLTYVDAGYYRGDGAFFLDGGAYADAGTPLDASTGGGLDASLLVPTCATLATCCASLQGSSQSLCTSTATANNAANCAAEQSQLAVEGNCTGVSVLASQQQVPPNRMVSDGTLLFWTTASTPGLLAMPVGGGVVTVLLEAPVANTNAYNVSVPDDTFLAVDNVNVYVLMSNALVRIPKAGGPATLVSAPGAFAIAATQLGAAAYWVENPMGPGDPGPNTVYALEEAPLLGGPVTTVASFRYPGSYAMDDLGVTSSTAFIGTEGPYANELFDFSLASPASTASLSNPCVFLTSDENALYCAQSSGSNAAIASDGTTTVLGSAVSSSYIVFDDTSVYWTDNTTVGTIMKSPKTGGGATVLARDTSPTAIAVDAKSVYWGDADGYIKSVPK
jgi:hypothetical protein